MRVDVIVPLLGPLGGVGPTEVRDGLAKVVEVIVHFVDRRPVLLVCGVGAPALFGRLGRVLGADAGLDALRVRLHGVVGPGGAAVVVGGAQIVEEGGRLEAVRVELLVGGLLDGGCGLHVGDSSGVGDRGAAAHFAGPGQAGRGHGVGGGGDAGAGAHGIGGGRHEHSNLSVM